MGRVCAVKDCKSGSVADNKRRHDLNLKRPGFFKVPKCPKQRQQWIDALFTELTEQKFVCELHFQRNEIQHSYFTNLPNGEVNIIPKGRVTRTPRAVPLIVDEESGNLSQGSDEPSIFNMAEEEEINTEHRKRMREEDPFSTNSPSKLEDLKKDKLSLEIFNLKLVNYKLQLEIYEKEKSNGISPSSFTRNFFVQDEEPECTTNDFVE